MKWNCDLKLVFISWVFFAFFWVVMELFGRICGLMLVVDCWWFVLRFVV